MGVVYQVDCGEDYLGNDLPSVNVDTFANCMLACSAYVPAPAGDRQVLSFYDDPCIGATYVGFNPDGNNCYLKSAIVEIGYFGEAFPAQRRQEIVLYYDSARRVGYNAASSLSSSSMSSTTITGTSSSAAPSGTGGSLSPTSSGPGIPLSSTSSGTGTSSSPSPTSSGVVTIYNTVGNGNFAYNASFPAGGLTVWSALGDATLVPGNAYHGDGNTGNYAVQLIAGSAATTGRKLRRQASSAAAPGIEQTVGNLSTTSTYTVSVWYYINETLAVNANPQNCAIDGSFDNAIFNSSYFASNTGQTSEWVQFLSTFTPSTSNGTLAFVVNCINSGSVEVLIDEIFVSDQVTPADINNMPLVFTTPPTASTTSSVSPTGTTTSTAPIGTATDTAALCPSANLTTYQSSADTAYTIYCGISFLYDDLTAVSATTFEQCMSACDNFVPSAAGEGLS
ncbi:hypothetical protein MMC32_004899 [Xylographa parallela]|nr:hypothetical protein [Xylographa parallela]